jgi:hypothetical protein
MRDILECYHGGWKTVDTAGWRAREHDVGSWTTREDAIIEEVGVDLSLWGGVAGVRMLMAGLGTV